jgi:hypothetical protein
MLPGIVGDNRQNPQLETVKVITNSIVVGIGSSLPSSQSNSMLDALGSLDRVSDHHHHHHHHHQVVQQQSCQQVNVMFSTRNPNRNSMVLITNNQSMFVERQVSYYQCKQKWCLLGRSLARQNGITQEHNNSTGMPPDQKVNS